MQMIIPIDVTDAVLLSSNVPETDYAVWSSVTAYVVGNRVILTAPYHSIYEAVAPSTNKHPVTDAAAATFWVRVGATNRWKAFDEVLTDQAELSGGITYSLSVASRCDGVALFKLDATSVTLQVKDPSATRRNLLIATEDLTDAAWTLVSAVFAGLVADPDGGVSAARFTLTAAPIGYVSQNVVTIAANTTASVYIRSPDLTSITLEFGAPAVALTISPEWQRINMTGTAFAGTSGFSCYSTTSGTIEIYHPQAEYGATTTDYQSVTPAGVWSDVTLIETRQTQDYGGIDGWWWYLFNPIIRSDAMLFLDVPGFAGTTVDISVNSVATAKVGEIALGQNFLLGTSHAGSSIGIQDYSRKERDTFGNSIIIERAFADRADYTFSFLASLSRFTRKLLADQRAAPTVYHQGPDTEEFGTLIYGFYKDFNIVNVYREHATATLQVEGLT